jgi:hypothetical protein
MLDNFQIIESDFDPLEELNSGTDLTSSKELITSGVIQRDPKVVKEKENKDNDPETVEIKSVTLTDDLIKTGLGKAKGVDYIPEPGPNDDDDDDEDDNEDFEGTGADRKPKKKTDPNSNVFLAHYESMVESGEWEAEEGFDGDPEKYVEIRNKNNERFAVSLVDEYFEDAFVKNPDGKELGIKLFNHLKNGGKIKDFRDLYEPAEFQFSDLDSDNEDIAEEAAAGLIRNYYTAAGWKPEAINKKIDSLKKTGRIVEEGKEIEEPYKDLIKNQQDVVAQRLEADNLAKKNNKAKINNTIKSLIDSNHSFGDIKLYENEKEKKRLIQSIFEAGENGMTDFSVKFNAALKDPEFLLFQALVLEKELYKSGKSKLKTGATAESEAAKKLKDTLSKSLLNKDVLNKSNDRSQANPGKNSSSKYKFNLDQALVVS